MVFYELVLLVPCLVYLNSLDYGSISTIVGAVVLLAFIPIWILTQKMNKNEMKLGTKKPKEEEDEVKDAS